MALASLTAVTIRANVYAEFLYGAGVPTPVDDWGVDLGRPQQYTRAGTIYRQDFERGVALANVGTEAVEVDLGGAFRDLNGVQCRSLVLAPGSADVLSAEPARATAFPRQG